uniref:Casein kinase substrate phosphoprotein PP28 domain-containing protein n=1 Tax=Pyramimonas obovata TaxID=1411642 RepID=A0A7S0RCA0_9CHLO|mmetsp:Transcript_30899/g.67500  ORF Transcript_30899/g.67500 Transcript_30899/m.67500 type:complete len:162 (+) Transcript_30899:92-577(+)
MARGRGRGGGKPGRRTFTSREQLEADGRDIDERRRDMPESDSDESDSDEEEVHTKKGVAGLIETANPNAGPSRNLKAKNLRIDDDDDEPEEKPQLSRREREEIEKQRAQERYWKLHEQGKTEQARKDLDRLSIIKQQRAEAAKKMEEEKAAREAAKTASRR